MTTPTTAEQIDAVLQEVAIIPDGIIGSSIEVRSIAASLLTARATIARLEGDKDTEAERITLSVCAALGIDPNLADGDGSDPVAWIVSAVQQHYEVQKQRADTAERERVAAINEMAKARRTAMENEDDAMLLRTLLSLDYERGGSGLLLGVHARARAADKALQTERTRADAAERRVDDMTPLARLGEWALERIRGVYAGDVDAFDVQDKATQFGVIAPQTAPKPCGECCVCAEMDADVCYRDTDTTTRARAALAAASGAADGAATREG